MAETTKNRIDRYEDGWVKIADANQEFVIESKTPSILELTFSDTYPTTGEEEAEQDFSLWTDSSTGTGTFTVNGNAVDIVGADASNVGHGYYNVTGANSDETYYLSAECTSFTSGEVQVIISADDTTASPIETLSFTSGTTDKIHFIAPAENFYIHIQSADSGGDAQISNISVQSVDVEAFYTIQKSNKMTRNGMPHDAYIRAGVLKDPVNKAFPIDYVVTTT